ncbi:Ankyrin repeat domain-containing protein [Tetrabaena socialis]|uniref:Ankyrin repeat domain-containing protein n=1 Tax=Tetrabaena socialis TaxID=47790 RepID=A0A2J8A2W9_9CHLO|nr:Ankyrin repeat domain-containing protein [Tetrabaena socialis]|eukprot:PNH06860.1 Ankyrin repeat domain-containing protein [Tetrabaena socialis]
MEQQQPLSKRRRTQPLVQEPPSTEQQPLQQQQQQQQQQQRQPEAAPGAASDDPSRATAAQVRGPAHNTVRLSLLVPHHAFVLRWGGCGSTRSLTVQQCHQLPCLTASSGSVANLEVLLARADLTSPMDAMVLEAAAGAGQLEVCRWLRQQGCPWDENVFDAAAGAGHKEVCEWLLAVGCPRTGDPMAAAACGGHQAVCECLLADSSLSSPVNPWVAAAAARNGHVGLMDWLLARTVGQGPDVQRLLAAAAAGCDLPTLQRLHHTYLDSRGEELPGAQHGQVLAAAAGSPTADWRGKVEWLEGRGYPWTERACNEVAQRLDGRDRLVRLQQWGYPISSVAAREAAEHGNADALAFVSAQRDVVLGEEFTSYTARFAALGGHLAVLQVLHAHAVPMDRHVVRSAAARGHLSVVAWLVETLGAAGALSADAFTSAAASGSAELVAWLHEHACPWDASVFATAASAGSEEQLEWLAERGCSMGDDGKPYRRALANADLAVLRCLRRLGCPWGPAGVTFTYGIAACCRRLVGSSNPARRKQLLLAVRWLVAQGCPVDWAAAEREAKRARDCACVGAAGVATAQPSGDCLVTDPHQETLLALDDSWTEMPDRYVYDFTSFEEVQPGNDVFQVPPLCKQPEAEAVAEAAARAEAQEGADVPRRQHPAAWQLGALLPDTGAYDHSRAYNIWSRAHGRRHDDASEYDNRLQRFRDVVQRVQWDSP